MKTKHLVILSIILAACVLLSVTTISKKFNKNVFTSHVRSQAKAILGQNVIVGTFDGPIVNEYEAVRDSLMHDFEYYSTIIDCYYNLKKNIPYNSGLMYEFAQQLKLLNEERYRQLYSTSWIIPVDKTPPQVYEKTLNTLLKDSGKHISLKCLVAKAKTFISRAKRGEYDKPLYQQYNVSIELPVSSKISYFGEIVVKIKPNGTSKPDLTNELRVQLAKAIQYKYENNCQ